MRAALQRRHHDDGFTMIEVATVMMILGTLAAIAIPSLFTQREHGWQAQAISDVRNAAVEVEAFATLDQVYPSGQAEFDTLELNTSPGVTLTYSANSSATEFCILADHAELPDAAEAVYAPGGARAGDSCPAFVNP